MPPKQVVSDRHKKASNASSRAGGAKGSDFIGNALAYCARMWNTQVIPYVESFDLQKLFRLHALSLVVVGSFLTFMPHTILQMFMNKMDHMTHEIYRLYGVLNVSIGYIIWKLRYIGDGRVVGRLIAETFCVCFILQALVILRAQLTNPAGHDFWHWMLAVYYIIVGCLYGYIRWVKTVKVFELPGNRDHSD
jgi:hypothetical protein